MINASLSYEVFIYLNSFYFGLFGTCELGIFILKAVNLPYNQSTLRFETIILVSFYIVETIRINLGRRGSLSDHGWQVILSVFLTIPAAIAVSFLFNQTYALKLEYILAALMLALQISELVFALIFLCSIFKKPNYD